MIARELPARLRKGYRRIYGASPLHLLALLASFALAGYAAQKASLGALPERMAVWFVAAAVLHDLALFPLYALADRSMLLLVRRRRRPAAAAAVPAVNHIRIPVLLSGLLLLVFAPVITTQGEGSYRAASGLNDAPYLDRWLLVSAALFGGSALLYAVRLGRAKAGKETS